MQNANNERLSTGHDPMPLGLQLKYTFHRLRNDVARTPRRLMITIIMGIALLAFEVFNYDTTRFALENLLGTVSFFNIGWAAILAIAFCSIDFAGLIRIFTPERGRAEPKEVWYLMGAWLLGATMNAIMTWWAVSLTVLNHELGNEIIDRETMLKVVPIFVALLVWLTRILFIGALSVAGEQLMEEYRGQMDEVQVSRQRPDAMQHQTQGVTVRQRQAVRLKERSAPVRQQQPRLAKQDALILEPYAHEHVIENEPEPVEASNPLADLFAAKPKTVRKPKAPPRRKTMTNPTAQAKPKARSQVRGVNRPKPNGGLRKPNGNLQAKPRQ